MPTVDAMGEQDRLAALLERATRERRGDDPDAAGVDDGRAEAGRGSEGSAREGGAESRGEPVTGGEWLPPDPGRHRGDGTRPSVLALPRSLRSVDVRVRPRAVAALLVVALIAAGVFGLRWWQAERGSAPVPIVPLAAEASPVRSGAGPGDVAAVTAPTAPNPSASSEGAPVTAREGAAAPVGDGAPVPAELLVHVAGEVRSPGVVRLEEGARVHDAVAAAGGLGPEADTTRLNLARTVADGERIWVPRPGEEVPELVDGVQTASPGPGPPGAASGGGASGTGSQAGTGEQININTADQAVLEELPGVGPVTAGAIIQWRTEHGRFSSPDELLEVSGIGEATLDKLRPHVTL